ncbi:hypothetical protein B0J17DRAFT_687634 [Rhizoctonia solani]|nr:hypothetical protein B0J17DRAFT_687634 [Rhizoctonia solani]
MRLRDATGLLIGVQFLLLSCCLDWIGTRYVASIQNPEVSFTSLRSMSLIVQRHNPFKLIHNSVSGRGGSFYVCVCTGCDSK